MKTYRLGKGTLPPVRRLASLDFAPSPWAIPSLPTTRSIVCAKRRVCNARIAGRECADCPVGRAARTSRLVTDWLGNHLEAGWASCPITQNGCIRILSQASYPNAVPAAQVAARLAEATLHSTHLFWSDSISLLAADCLQWDKVLSSRQVTDLYLLALTVQHKGCFVTLDRGIPLTAVKGAQSKHLVTIL